MLSRVIFYLQSVNFLFWFSILNAAYRTLGIMRKLKYRFNRQAPNQMYISYIRPTLEYSSIVWYGCSEQDKIALEKLQNEAARIVTGLTRSTYINTLETHHYIFYCYSHMVWLRIFSWSYIMSVYNEKRFAVIWLCLCHSI